MLISEKQVFALMNFAQILLTIAVRGQLDRAKDITNVLNEIANQQSTKLKEVSDDN